MRILVSGGFGYLGSHISNHFLNKGHTIKILSRSVHPELFEWSRQFEVVIGDVSDYASIENCCQNIDIVIHAAALNEVDCRAKHKEALLVNGYGTRNVLEDAYRNDVKKFIYLSTFHVYGPPKTEIITEETPPDPVNSYSITHYLAERYCHQFEVENKVRSYILRISNGYGAPLFRSIQRWTLVVNDLCFMAYKQKRIVLKSKGTQERDFVAIKDILQGVEIFVENDAEGENSNIYNVGGENNVSIISLAGIVADVYKDRYGESITIEIPKDAAEPDITLSFRFSIDKIKKRGYQPTAVMKNELHNIFELLEG